MSNYGLLLIALAAVLTAAANLFLRAGVLSYGGLNLAPSKIFTDLLGLFLTPAFTIGFILYGLAAVVWFGVLSVENLSTSYPLLVGLTFVLVGTGAMFFFGESLTPQKLLGMFVILSGIVLVARA